MPEKAVAQVLKTLRLKVVRHRNPLVKFTYPDFILPKRRICIYVDGDYWHRESGEKDRLQKRVLRAAGFKVLRIPEKKTKDQRHLKRILRRAIAEGAER